MKQELEERPGEPSQGKEREHEPMRPRSTSDLDGRHDEDRPDPKDGGDRQSLGEEPIDEGRLENKDGPKARATPARPRTAFGRPALRGIEASLRVSQEPHDDETSSEAPRPALPAGPRDHCPSTTSERGFQ